MPPDNLDAVRELYRAFASAGLAPDVEWSSPHPDAAHLRGREEVATWVGSYAGTFDEFRHEPDELHPLADGRVLAFFTETARGRRSGLHTRVEGAAIWTLRDGRVVRMQAFLDREQALEAAGLPTSEDGGGA